MGAEKTPQGRLRVDRFLQAAPGVFAAGDCASVRRGEGELRMSVQFALSGGTAAARNALLRLAGRPMEEYRPADPGYVIPLANGRACGRVLGMNARGRLPILLHMAMGVYRTPDARQAFRLLAALARPAKR
jgi:NADH dehydrogenase FAD-containing subunit